MTLLLVKMQINLNDHFRVLMTQNLRQARRINAPHQRPGGESVPNHIRTHVVSQVASLLDSVDLLYDGVSGPRLTEAVDEHVGRRRPFLELGNMPLQACGHMNYAGLARLFDCLVFLDFERVFFDLVPLEPTEFARTSTRFHQGPEEQPKRPPSSTQQRTVFRFGQATPLSLRFLSLQPLEGFLCKEPLLSRPGEKAKGISLGVVLGSIIPHPRGSIILWGHEPLVTSLGMTSRA